MNPSESDPNPNMDQSLPALSSVRVKPASSNTTSSSSSSVNPTTAATPTAGARRKIAIAVDLSDESAHAVKWAVQHYLRPGDAVILLHVRPTSVLYGADWGSIDMSIDTDNCSEESQQKLEDDFDNFTTSKAADVAQPLVDAQIPFKIHIVKDHDMKERLYLEVESLGLSVVIMGVEDLWRLKGVSRAGSGVSLLCVPCCCCSRCCSIPLFY